MTRSDFGRRLDRAIRLPGRPGSIREFQKRLEDRVGDRERFGYSYPTVNSYLTGSAAPTLTWIREVADLLEVSPQWLSFGSEGSLEDVARQREGWREQHGSAAAYAPPNVIEEDREELRRLFGTDPVLYMLIGLPPSAVNRLQEVAYKRERSLGGLASELLTRAIESEDV